MARVIIYTTNYCPYCFAAKPFFAPKKSSLKKSTLPTTGLEELKWNVCLAAEQCRRSLLTANHLVVTTISDALMPPVNWMASLGIAS